MTYSHGE